MDLGNAGNKKITVIREGNLSIRINNNIGMLIMVQEVLVSAQLSMYASITV